MNKAVTKLEAESEVITDPLAMLRAPFPPHQISKLPKETGFQAKQRKTEQDAGNWPAKCTICGGQHHPKAVHLDYVGHAAATDRLLDADPRWTWAPVADPMSKGLPMAPGGMWIELTVDGVTRLGFGDAAGKTGGDAVKEAIGDAIRNAGMRFGMALDLWHKGDLHAEPEEPVASMEEKATTHLRSCAAVGKAQFKDAWTANRDGWKATMDGPAYARVAAEMQRLAAAFPKEPEPQPAPQPAADDFGLGDDEIPF